MSEKANHLSDIFDDEDSTLPADVPDDDADLRKRIGDALGFGPENPAESFTKAELAEVYVALKDAGYKP